MTYTYRGYRIDRCMARQWNIYLGDEVLDATSTLAEAKYLIRCWTDKAENARRLNSLYVPPILPAPARTA